MIIDYGSNHIFFKEHGLKYSRLEEKDRSTRRYKGSFAESKMTRAYNIKGGSQKAQQYGGAAILTIGDPTTNIANTDMDLTGLGRWRYQEIEGVGLV